MVSPRNISDAENVANPEMNQPNKLYKKKILPIDHAISQTGKCFRA